MSFNANTKGTGYEPGYFLANDENCVRETKQFSADSALAKTGEEGGKYIPMGTAFPTNDGSAIGITYEDVDVSWGDAPGSVVTSGEVYEDKLAITGASYSEASGITSADNPVTEGWYEKGDGDSYSLSTDTVASRTKKYYESDGQTPPTYTQVATIVYGDNPKELGLYESDGQTPPTYTLSTDTQADASKTYYAQNATRLAGTAKTALMGLGFKFRSSTEAVTRPY